MVNSGLCLREMPSLRKMRPISKTRSIAGDQHPLQVELERDPQVEVNAERVVVGREGLGRRAAGDGLEDRRLDLDELPRLEEAADRGDDPRAQQQAAARLPVHDEVEVALAVHLLGVGEAVPLLGQRPQRLREERARLDADGDLAGLRPEERPPRPDDVAQVELPEGRVGVVADDVLPHVELDLALLVQDLGKLALAHVADRDEPAGDGHRDRVVLALDVGLERLAREMGRSRTRSGRGPAPTALSSASFCRRTACWSWVMSAGISLM